MSQPPKFDDRALAAAWGPPAHDRRARVKLIAEAAQILLKDGSQAALFTGGALLKWLQEGGNLERDYFQVAARAGSHHTASYLYQDSSSRGGLGEREVDKLDPSSSESESS